MSRLALFVSLFLSALNPALALEAPELSGDGQEFAQLVYDQYKKAEAASQRGEPTTTSCDFIEGIRAQLTGSGVDQRVIAYIADASTACRALG